MSYSDREVARGGDISIGGRGEYQSLVFFLGASGGKETTSCNLVSENADLKGGLARALEIAFGAGIAGMCEDFVGSPVHSGDNSLESESDEVTTTEISF